VTLVAPREFVFQAGVDALDAAALTKSQCFMWREAGMLAMCPVVVDQGNVGVKRSPMSRSCSGNNSCWNWECCA